MVKEVIYKWSVTQTLNLTHQLQNGIRYLDLRIGCKPGSDEFHIVHGLFGLKLADVLNEVVSFLDRHSKEIVFLDFHKNYLSENQQNKCLDVIADKLGSRCCPRLDIDSTTLDIMWENKLQVLVFHKEDEVKPDFRFWSKELMLRPWPRIAKVDDLIKFLEQKYRDRCHEKFHVTQGVLSPNESFIICHLSSSLKDETGLQVAEPFVAWLKGKRAGEKGINICMMDYVELDNYIPTVLALNQSVCKANTLPPNAAVK